MSSKTISSLVVPILSALFASVLLAITVCCGLYMYHMRKEDCRCAIDDTENRIMEVYLGVSVTLLTYTVVYALLAAIKSKQELPKWMTVVRSTLALLHIPLSIAFIVFGVRHIKRIRERQCMCAKNDPMWWSLETLVYLRIASLGLSAVAIVLALTVGLSIMISRRK